MYICHFIALFILHTIFKVSVVVLVLLLFSTFSGFLPSVSVFVPGY